MINIFGLEFPDASAAFSFFGFTEETPLPAITTPVLEHAAPAPRISVCATPVLIRTKNIWNPSLLDLKGERTTLIGGECVKNMALLQAITLEGRSLLGVYLYKGENRYTLNLLNPGTVFSAPTIIDDILYTVIVVPVKTTCWAKVIPVGQIHWLKIAQYIQDAVLSQ